MARKLRLQYAGAISHLMSRGDRREPVSLEEADRRLFLATLGEACAKTDWQVHGWCLISNHFHPVVETSPGQPGGGHEMAFGNLHRALQPPTPVLRGTCSAGVTNPCRWTRAGTATARRCATTAHLELVRARRLRPDQPLRRETTLPLKWIRCRLKMVSGNPSISGRMNRDIQEERKTKCEYVRNRPLCRLSRNGAL